MIMMKSEGSIFMNLQYPLFCSFFIFSLRGLLTDYCTEAYGEFTEAHREFDNEFNIEQGLINDDLTSSQIVNQCSLFLNLKTLCCLRVTLCHNSDLSIPRIFSHYLTYQFSNTN